MARKPKAAPPAGADPGLEIGSTQHAPVTGEVLPREDKALTLPLPQGTSIAEYAPTAIALNEMAAKIAGHTFDCTTTAGDTEARQTRKVFVELRTALDKKRLELKRPLLARGAELDAEARKIEAAIVAMEEPIDAIIKAQEAIKNAEREERERAERARQAALDAELEAIRMLPMTLIGKTSTEIDAAIERVLAAPRPEEPERFDRVRETTLATLNTMLESARTAEETKRRLDEQAAEVARRRDQEEAEARAAQVARDRAAAQDSMLAKLREFPLAYIGASAARIQTGIDTLGQYSALSEVYDADHLEAADVAHRAAIDKLVEMREAAVTREADDKRRQEEETARRLADQRRDRVAQMQANLQAVPMRALTATSEAIANMAAELRGASFTSEEADDFARLTELRDTVVQQLQDLYTAAAGREADAAAAATREAEAQERARAAAEQAEAEAIANATLYDAATDAALLLEESGHGGNIITRKLHAALQREPAHG